MADPYHAVQSEIQSTLQNAETLKASYLRIRATAREESEEVVWARNEVGCSLRIGVGKESECLQLQFKATLAALEADLEDLEESVISFGGGGGRDA